MHNTANITKNGSTFDFTKRYKVAGHGGVAFRAIGHPLQMYEYIYHEAEDEFGYESVFEADYSQVIAIIVGDDYQWTFDVDDLTPLEDTDYCSECGQIGCGWGH